MGDLKVPVIQFHNKDPQHGQKVSDLVNEMLGTFATQRDSAVKRDVIIALAGSLCVEMAIDNSMNQKQKRNNFHVFSDMFDTCLEKVWTNIFKEDLWLVK